MCLQVSLQPHHRSADVSRPFWVLGPHRAPPPALPGPGPAQDPVPPLRIGPWEEGKCFHGGTQDTLSGPGRLNLQTDPQPGAATLGSWPKLSVTPDASPRSVTPASLALPLLQLRTSLRSQICPLTHHTGPPYQSARLHNNPTDEDGLVSWSPAGQVWARLVPSEACLFGRLLPCAVDQPPCWASSGQAPLC